MGENKFKGFTKLLSMMKKNICFLLFVLLSMGCGRNKTPSPENQVGLNTLYNRFQADEKGNVFVLRENGIRLLEWNGIENLNLVELPFKEKTENVSGNKDTLLINTNGKLSIIVNNKGIVEEIGSIKGFKSCDKFEKKGGLIFAMSGNSECNKANTNPTIKVFNVSDVTKIVEVFSIKLTNPQDLVFDNNLLFVADNNNGLLIFEKDQNGVLKLLNRVENVITHQLTIQSKKKIIIVKNNSEVRQYDYSNSSSPKLLSTIVLTK
jgi:hypothetical protein